MPITTGVSGKSNPAGGERLVSSAERTGFVEAVLAGNLDPDFSAVAYHFEGWLDKGAGDTYRGSATYAPHAARTTTPLACRGKKGWYDLCM